nr:fructose-specific PTS transporter subunit EIIC [Lachnospiraceae bacterium]
MENRRINLQIFAMFAVILVAFIGSVLFYSWINTSNVRDAVEAECSAASTRLSQVICEKFSYTDIISGNVDEVRLSKVMDELDIDSDIDIWLVDHSGNIYIHNNRVESGTLSDEDAYNSLSGSTMIEYHTWLGRYSPFLLTQQYLIIRPLYVGKIFLLLKHSCAGEQAKERRQFAQSLCMDLVLIIIILVLGTNIISGYHRQVVLLATTDELTKLANRKSFTEEFNRIARQEDQTCRSLFLLDIDYFKQINDRYGHAAGDEALSCLSGKILSLMQHLHGFAGRWGGDEIIGIVPLSGGKAAEELKELCRTISALSFPEGFTMTISAGVADFEGDVTLSKLTERADRALYDSKRGGRNTVTLFCHELTESDKKPAVENLYISAEKSSVSAASHDAQKEGEGEARDKIISFEYLKNTFLPSVILSVRWMVPFVAAGGILIALAFLFDAASVNLSALPLSRRSLFGSITPLAAILKEIGSATFNFMLPVFAGFMAYGIAGEEAFMAGFVGGFMTIESNSGFVGAMIAGFAAGFLAGEIKKFTGHLPKFLRKAAPVMIYPVFSLFLMQLLSWFIITPVSSALGWVFKKLLDMAVDEGRIISGAFSAMMMAVDMGGIVNKTAYNYGVSGLSLGRSVLMASVMAGGMVPPIGIFLSMLLFKKKFTEEERDRRTVTLFMGLSFITEGALPYVFTDFFRVIPCCMVGSAVSGALSSAFGCALPAPHGGIFVFPVMGHPLLYTLSILAGSLVAAVLLGFLKKEKSP